MSTTYNLSPIGIWKLDTSFKIIKVNPVVYEQLAECEADIIGMSIFDVISLGSEEAFEPVMSGCSVNLERQHVRFPLHPDRKVDCWNLSAWPVKDSEDRIQGACIGSSVVPERYEPGLTDFMDTLVHDLKSPLVGTCMTLEALLRSAEGKLDAGQMRALTMLLRSNKDTLDMLHNLIGLNKLATMLDPPSSDTCLYDVVRESLKGLMVLANCRGVGIVDLLPSEGGEISGDPSSLRRAFTNLLNNAIKFTNSGGSIQLSCEETSDSVIVHIKDSGIGIPADEITGLFVRYNQGSRGRRFIDGSGLGLYLSKNIVEAHGGTISVDSSEGVGSTFSVAIPRNVR